MSKHIEYKQQTCADLAEAAMKMLPGCPVFVRIVGGSDAGALYPVKYIASGDDRLVLVVAI